jgi:hypothetical protein
MVLRIRFEEFVTRAAFPQRTTAVGRGRLILGEYVLVMLTLLRNSTRWLF